MTTTRSSIAVALCLGATTAAGCAYYAPHSLVATNIRTTDRDALVSGSRRVEAEVCGNRLLAIPFGPDPRITTVTEALQQQVTNAVGFEDIQIDVSRVIYFPGIFWQDCVQASAFPLIPVTKPRAAQPQQPQPKAEPAAAQPATPAPASDPQKFSDPFQQ
jgi:hypothetical protein